jgi:hypothetical protein
VNNITRIEIPIIDMVIHPIMLDNSPFVLSSSIFLSLAIFIMVIRIGTATIALMRMDDYDYDFAPFLMLPSGKLIKKYLDIQ